MVLLEQLTCHGLRPSTESWGWTFHFPHPPGSGCTCQTSQVFNSQKGESRCSVCAILLIYRTTICSQGQNWAHLRVFVRKCDAHSSQQIRPPLLPREARFTDTISVLFLFYLQSATCDVTLMWLCLQTLGRLFWGLGSGTIAGVPPRSVLIGWIFTLPPFTLSDQNSRKKVELWNSFVAEKQ